MRNAHLAPVKAIEYKARDGLEIQAILTLPAGRPAKSLPLIMLPHGGPWAFDTLRYDYWAQFLANRGYAVMQPNFRGSTGYGVDFERKGEGQMGAAMQDDITDGMRWAVAQGIADPKRVCIMGASYGGYAAMWGVVKDPDLYRCSISIAGVASVRKTVNDFDSNSNNLGWGRMAPNFEAISPINFVEKIKVPMLLIHGKKDVTVSVDNSRKMFSRMQKAGKNVQYVELPEADHHFQRQADRMTLLSTIETFLNTYNPADTPVASGK